MNFTASAPGTAHPPGKAFYFIFDTQCIRFMVTEQDGTLPCLEQDQAKRLCPGPLFFFGHLGEMPCYCTALPPDAPVTLPRAYSQITLRSFFHRSEERLRLAAGYARQILDLHLNSKFCGKCGTPTRPGAGEHARECPECRQTAYPRISPAIITSVTREDEILLARGVNFPNKEMFSVLAGFVSPSETLEDCVRREVFEETRIRVSRVRYVKSQPWPFPDSLMIGFTARYESGEIAIDPREINEAAWFKFNALPLIPDAHTLAGQLIREFVNSRA